MILTVEAADSGRRIDVFLSSHTSLTRSAAQKLLTSDDESVSVNGFSVQKNYKVCEGDIIELTIPEPIPLEVKAENIPLDILYEDSDLILVNKPKGMVVHPAPGHYSQTLVNALLYHCASSLSGINGVIRPGIVHRIDRDTSGVLVVAKNDAAHVSLAEQIKVHSVDRVYHAIVIGCPKEDTATIDAPIARHPSDRKRMAVSEAPGARRAVTHYRVLQRFKGYSYCEFRLETGRTHQIRVHMASRGHPLLGDPVYGRQRDPLEMKYADLLGGQCLHAKSLGFIHPTTKEYVLFDTPLPAYFDTILSVLNKRQ